MANIQMINNFQSDDKSNIFKTYAPKIDKTIELNFFRQNGSVLKKTSMQKLLNDYIVEFKIHPIEETQRLIFNDIKRIEYTIIKNLLDNKNYLNDYVSFLLGAYDDEEFKEISKKYIKEFADNKISNFDIFYTFKLLSNIQENEVTPNDVMSALNITPSRIEKITKVN